jgi:hypothetical protein
MKTVILNNDQIFKIHQALYSLEKTRSLIHSALGETDEAHLLAREIKILEGELQEKISS